MFMLRTSYRLLVTIAVIVLLLLVFVVGWPFAGLRVFSTEEKLTVGATALVIQKIRSIAELATAEYYGEVICTLDSAITDEVQRDLEKNFRRIQFIYEGQYQEWLAEGSKDAVVAELMRPILLSRQYEDMLKFGPPAPEGDRLQQFCKFLSANEWEAFAAQARARGLSKRQARRLEQSEQSYRLLRNRYMEVYQDTARQEQARVRLATNGFLQLELSRTPSYLELRNLVSRLESYRLYDDDDINFLEVMRREAWPVAGFKQVLLANGLSFEEAEARVADLRQTKAQLAYIGRGVVRAGFYLDSLNEEAITIRQERDTLEVLIDVTQFAPVILDTILNPWFVPPDRVSMESDGAYSYQGGIRGFQVVYQENHRQITQRDVGLVKQSCKNQLAEQALANHPNILDEAAESARLILRSWLSLLAPDQEVVVRFSSLEGQ